MNKKYPKDTPVTLEMLLEIDSRPGPMAAKIHSMIEPPKPEPKEGEWWLCQIDQDIYNVMYFHNGHFRKWPGHADWYSPTPLYKMVPEKVGE